MGAQRGIHYNRPLSATRVLCPPLNTAPSPFGRLLALGICLLDPNHLGNNLVYAFLSFRGNRKLLPCPAVICGQCPFRPFILRTKNKSFSLRAGEKALGSKLLQENESLTLISRFRVQGGVWYLLVRDAEARGPWGSLPANPAQDLCMPGSNEGLSIKK